MTWCFFFPPSGSKIAAVLSHENCSVCRWPVMYVLSKKPEESREKMHRISSPPILADSHFYISRIYRRRRRMTKALL
jgi:hypothetical protein